MASKSIVLKGTTYNGVESIELPQSGGGDVLFTEVSDTTATASDVASGKYFYTAAGVKTAGTASGGGANIQALSVTQNGTYTASGVVDGYSPVTVNVAGSSIPWLGQGAEKVGTVINRVINLKDDTDYDNWTASTTATTLIPADTDPSYTLSANVTDYDYCFVTRGYIEPVYLSGTPTNRRTHKIAQYHVQYYYGITGTSDIEKVRADEAGNIVYLQTSTNICVQYFYNLSGDLAARNASQCGPLYMSNTPSFSNSTVSDGVSTITLKFPVFYAKCDSSRFATERKEQVDSANTNYYLTVDLYRVPHGSGMMSHWVSAMCADLNAV